jgi:hypothetical protein
VNTQSHILDLEDRIDLYVKGVLSQNQIDDLWVDVIQNDYLDYMKTAATVRKLSVGKNVTPIPLFQRERTRRFTAAAAAAVVIGIGTSLYYLSGSETAPGFSPLAKIEYSLLRSSKTANEAFDAKLQDITVMALQGDATRAEAELTLLAQSDLTEAQRSSVTLSLAALNYNRGDDATALAGFQSILDQPSQEDAIREKAAWYAANTLIRMNRFDDADRYLQLVIQLDGAYKRAAITASDHLRRR